LHHSVVFAIPITRLQTLQISEDFALLQESAAEKMSLMWPQLYVALMDKIRNLKVRDKHLKEMVDSVKFDAENPTPTG